MRKSKHNYDSEDFYNLIEQYAKMGFTDKEISKELNLSHETFSRMKHGKCQRWSKEQNANRSRSIMASLQRGRIKINALIRAEFLRAALGGRMIHSVIRAYVVTIDENGNPIGDRVLHGITEKVWELPPNMRAIASWLYHFDPEWRRIERAKDEALSIDNEKWIAANTS